MAPITDDHVPALQFMHLCDPIGAHVPRAQLLQESIEVAPIAEDHVPPAHLLHAERASAPITDDHVPASHFVHAYDPAADHEPLEH